MKLNGFVLFQIMVFDFDKVLSSFDVIVSLPANGGMHNGYKMCSLSIIRDTMRSGEAVSI